MMAGLRRFADRRDAGRRLADALAGRALVDPVVLALPRGGVPVAAEVAAALGAPLEVFVARKIGAPGQPEFGIGAIAEGGHVVHDAQLLAQMRIDDAQFARRRDAERSELERRVQRYRGDRALPDLHGRDVVLVDDGLATGRTAAAALGALRSLGARTLILAVPVCAPGSRARLAGLADEIVTVLAPDRFSAVGQWYDHFDQTSDAEVIALLRDGRNPS